MRAVYGHCARCWLDSRDSPQGCTTDWCALFGTPSTTRRIDTPTTPEYKARLRSLLPEDVKESVLAGESITAKLTRTQRPERSDRRAEGGDGPRVVRGPAFRHGRRVQALPAESFEGREHLELIAAEVQQILTAPRTGRASGRILTGFGLRTGPTRADHWKEGQPCSWTTCPS